MYDSISMLSCNLYQTFILLDMADPIEKIKIYIWSV